MWASFTTLGAAVLVLALLTAFLLILVARQQRTGRDIAIWFLSGVAGVLLGVAGSVAAVSLRGYELVRSAAGLPPEAVAALGAASPPGAGGQPVLPDFMPGMSSSPGGSAGGGPGGGFGGAPSPQRQLASLVRKIELLTSDLGLNLSPEQSAELLQHLHNLDVTESLTDEEAQAKQDAILAMLSDEQKAKEQAIGLPRPQGGPGGSPRGGGPPAATGGNPFREGANHDALRRLTERLGGQPANPAPAAPAPDAPAPDAQP